MFVMDSKKIKDTMNGTREQEGCKPPALIKIQ